MVPEKSIGSSFNDEPLSDYGFWADWHVEPKWNLCNAPGSDNDGKVLEEAEGDYGLTPATDELSLYPSARKLFSSGCLLRER